MKSIDWMLIKLIAWSIRPGIGLLQVHLCHRSLRRLQSSSNTPSLLFIISLSFLLSIQFFMRTLFKSTNYFKLNFIYFFISNFKCLSSGLLFHFPVGDLQPWQNKRSFFFYYISLLTSQSCRENIASAQFNKFVKFIRGLVSSALISLKNVMKSVIRP